MSQLVLNLKESHRVTNDAVKRAEQLVTEERKAEMYDAILQAAKGLSFLTSDDIWVILGPPKNRWDGSALGPVFREAAKCLVVSDTRQFQRSKRPIQHRRPVTIWKSLIYHGGESQ